MKLLMENWRGYLKEGIDAYYHVARSEEVPSIKKGGLKTSIPTDMEDIKGVYLFKSVEDAEDAVMNWLGDRFDEEEKLTLLKIDPNGVDELFDDAIAGFEVVSKSDISPEFISVEQETF